MNPRAIAAVAARPVRLPLRRPFVTALGRKSHSDNVWVRVRLADGTEGWGEASSSLAMPLQTGPRMAAALGRLGREARGRDVRDAGHLTREAWRSEPGTPAAVSAFECALTDALCRAEGIPFFTFFGGARRRLKTIMSVSAVDPGQVSDRVREGRRSGFDVFKLKLNGREPAALNRDRVRAAHRAAPRARLLLDPNQSYGPGTLGEFLDLLHRDGLAVGLVEEPFPKRNWAALKAFPRRKGTPLILDESVQTPADARKVAAGRLADGVNVKLAKSGLSRSKEIINAFSSPISRLPSPLFMMGCMCESKVGLAAAAQFAMGAGVFEHCDLDSDLLLKPMDIPGGYVRRGPWLSLPRNPKPGLGISSPSFAGRTR